MWRNTLGSTTDLAADGTGDDLTGTPDGDVDPWDYDFWKANFGNTLNSGSGSNQTAPAGVPEPTTATFLCVALFALLVNRRGDRRAAACLAVVVLLLTVAARPAAALVVFDHIGTPAETNNNGRLQSVTFTDQANEYSTAATRFTVAEDATGDRLAAVVWGEGPGGTGPIDWNQVDFLIQVWNRNPGIGTNPFAQGGNVHFDHQDLGGHPVVGGSLVTPWGSAASGTVNTYRIEFDVSDVSFQAGIEYWLAVRDYLPFETLGEIGLMTFDETTSVVAESDVWASSAVCSTALICPDPGEGSNEDNWIYLAGIGSAAFKHFAYSLTVTPETLPGDYNGNGTVDAADYTVWRDTLGSTADPRADGTGDDLAGTPDGDVDQWDYDFWKANFGSTVGSGNSQSTPAGVPEPASWFLIVLAGGGLAVYRRNELGH